MPTLSLIETHFYRRLGKIQSHTTHKALLMLSSLKENSLSLIFWIVPIIWLPSVLLCLEDCIIMKLKMSEGFFFLTKAPEIYSLNVFPVFSTVLLTNIVVMLYISHQSIYMASTL